MPDLRRPLAGAWGFAKGRSHKERFGGLAGVLLLVTVPFGGLHPEPAPQPAALTLGQPLDIGPFAVTVKKVVTLPDLLPAVKPDIAGDRLLVIDAVITNQTQRPEFAAEVIQDPVTQDLVFYGSGTGAVPWSGDASPIPRMYDVADSSQLQGSEMVNPGVTYEVAIVLEQSANWTPGDITLGVNAYSFQAVDPMTLDDDRWVLGGTLAEGRVPVEVKQ